VRRRATEAHALRLRAVAAGAGSGEDQLALELGQATQHREHQGGREPSRLLKPAPRSEIAATTLSRSRVDLASHPAG